ncbi:hypothetical protein SAY86_014527 [Trapa natans]|uniref:Epidermal patterning factor-like protein n=1 Tax=Trapa natans TaxID=22666 RepID=A0AAN7KSV0_TRANT|nr:hypothetical protein SAY86_014430 [Trapa natans]KAK4772752.1 hypothetical protein SAY86_014527 [Trapa natans]
MAMGSRPPNCINKCSSCRPCVPTLVATGRHGTSSLGKDGGNSSGVFTAGQRIGGREEEDDQRYYLLTWRCRCRDKIYDPGNHVDGF